MPVFSKYCTLGWPGKHGEMGGGEPTQNTKPCIFLSSASLNTLWDQHLAQFSITDSTSEIDF